MWNALPEQIRKRLVMGLQGHAIGRRRDSERARHLWLDHELLGLDTAIDTLATVESIDVATTKRHRSSVWPPPGTRTMRLTTSASDAFGSLALHGEQAQWHDHNPFLSEDDVLSGSPLAAGVSIVLRSLPFARDVRIVDQARLDLMLSSDQASTHVHAVLFDEAPSGQRTAITRGALNSTNHVSERRSDPLAPGQAWRARFALIPTDYTLRSGHRLGLALMSVNQTTGRGGNQH